MKKNDLLRQIEETDDNPNTSFKIISPNLKAFNQVKEPKTAESLK